MAMLAVPDGPPPAPRPFPARALDAATVFLLIFGAVWALIGAVTTVALTFGGGPLWDDLLLDARGVGAAAHVDGLAPTRSRINGAPVYRIDYDFTDAAGARHTGSARTARFDVVARIDRAAPISIEYDPASPARGRLRGERASLFGLLVLLPLSMAVAGGTLAGFGMRRRSRLRAVYVHGQAALATVTNVARTSMQINNQRVLRVDYVFDTVAGQFAGRTTTRRPPAVGERIWVLYLGDDPLRNVAA